MQITGWTYWDDPAYELIDGLWELEEAPYNRDYLRQLIIDELKKRGYQFGGVYHQDGDFGVPIIDDKYTVGYSYRGWGDIMASALGLQDDMAYCDWAWTNPDGEREVFPNEQDYKDDCKRTD